MIGELLASGWLVIKGSDDPRNVCEIVWCVKLQQFSEAVIVDKPEVEV